MKLSNIVFCAFDKADANFEQYFMPGGNPNPPRKKNFDYLGMMRRMYAHVTRHPNSLIKNFPLALGENVCSESVQEISRDELGEALKLLDKNQMPFRVDEKKGVLAVLNKEKGIEIFNFKLAA